jgi:cyclophilin family peptidyl-prolyl cis-trans isomerase
MPRHPKSPNGQKKPFNPRKQAIQTAQKRESRGRIYLAIIVVMIIALGVGWYVYSSSQSTSSPPDFSINAPTVVTIHAGNQVTSRVNVTAMNNFRGMVQLSAIASNGLTATISPATISGSGAATLATSALSNGTYTVTITGTSGSLNHSVAPVVGTSLYATLNTASGPIVVELYGAQAPKTVNNFVSLAKSGFYSNLVWHRIVKGFVIQTGDPNTRNGGGDRSTWGTGGSSQTVPLEINPALHNDIGYLGMARSSDPNSGSSQFYINLANNNSLDGNYTVFGKVVNSGGMDAANAIANVPVNSQSQPITPVFLISVQVSGSQ